MAIPDAFQKNFNTLLRAAKNGDLCLMECLDATTREVRYVLCATHPAGDGSDEICMVPFGHLAPGNPFEAYLPPDPNKNDGFIEPVETKSEATLETITQLGKQNRGEPT